jgi:hypothetical protein
VIGKTPAHYEILGPLGRGEVYRAADRKLGFRS